MKIYNRIIKDKIGSEDLSSIAHIMSLKGKSAIPPFTPVVDCLKDGTRIRIEPRNYPQFSELYTRK